MLTLQEIHSIFLKCAGGVVIDTRKMVSSCFFIALKGENFDANTFTETALESGAKYVLSDNKQFYIDERTILVEDCLTSLQKLAQYHRNYLKTKIIAITGSNGKTTTKELIYAVLSQKYKTLATIGNLNNHIGVPLTLLRLNTSHEIAIVEMGANHQKEIEFLCALAQPDFGYITNFGKAHLEGFGGVEGVIKGKSEMYQHLIQNNKYIFINADDVKQMERAKGGKLITYAMNEMNAVDYFFSDVNASPFVNLGTLGTTFNSNLTGIYNATNVMAAISIGLFFEVDLTSIQNAIANYIPENNRSQIIERNTNKILLDAYNANPSSMLVAISHFIDFYEKDKVLILGDMFELGDEAHKEHLFIVDFLKNKENVICYFVGKYFKECIIENNSLFFFENVSLFKDFLKTNPLQNKSILIKGSRGIALEQILDSI